VKELFEGPSPHQFGFENPNVPLLGATPAQISAAYPDLVEREDDELGLVLPPAGRGRIPTSVTLDVGESSRVTGLALTASAPSDRVSEIFAARLGEPVPGRHYDTRADIFLDSANGLRTIVAPLPEQTDHVIVQIERYRPLETLLTPRRSGEAHFAFEGDQSWLGRLSRERFDALADGQGSLHLLPTEFDAGFTAVRPVFEGKYVDHFTFDVGYELAPTQREHIVDAFEAAYGPAQTPSAEGTHEREDKAHGADGENEDAPPSDPPERPRWVFSTDPPIVLEQSNTESLRVRVGPARPPAGP